MLASMGGGGGAVASEGPIDSIEAMVRTVESLELE